MPIVSGIDVGSARVGTGARVAVRVAVEIRAGVTVNGDVPVAVKVTAGVEVSVGVDVGVSVGVRDGERSNLYTWVGVAVGPPTRMIEPNMLNSASAAVSRTIPLTSSRMMAQG